LPPFDLVIRSRGVVLPDGTRPAAVGIRDGKIIEVWPYDAAAVPQAAEETRGVAKSAGAATVENGAAGAEGGAAQITLGDDEVLLPGLVDTHVHVNEPGRTDWEGFASATRAAAAGGITTIIDMPLNSLPPTTDAGALRAKRQAAAGQIHVDVGFWGGAVPGSMARLPGLHAAGAFGIKVFLVDSGVPEFPPVGEAGLGGVMRQAAALGSVVLVHAEDAAAIEAAPRAGGPGYGSFLRSRPAAAEVTAIARVIELARRTGARAHVLHLSAADAIGLLADARRSGVRVTAETCPHYLALAAEDVPDGATQFKCCPPIRERANRERLWLALREGVIDCVVSDHSPCPPSLKRMEHGEKNYGDMNHGDFGAAWGGISSVQVALPVVWTQARARGHSLDDVARWMAAGPAAVAGLAGKGGIAPGLDADLVAFAPDDSFTVRPERLLHRHRLTPYAGQRLHGVVRRTWLRGALVTGERPSGRLLTSRGGEPS
jgi:allantoinase